jgi:hypothetical protein
MEKPSKGFLKANGLLGKPVTMELINDVATPIKLTLYPLPVDYFPEFMTLRSLDRDHPENLTKEQMSTLVNLMKVCLKESLPEEDEKDLSVFAMTHFVELVEPFLESLNIKNWEKMAERTQPQRQGV